MCETDSREKVLLMLSGGRDSFLSACHLIENGYYVCMATYDNGHMSMVENAQNVAMRVIKRYGEDNAEFVGVSLISHLIFPLYSYLLYNEVQDISKKYPNLVPSQVNCLACHTAMYVESIAYCKLKSINYIAEGARLEQGFFVELQEMKERYERLCKEHDIKLLTPVYNLESDWERKQLLAMRGFLPKTFEPQCWLGCPLKEPLSTSQRKSLANFYDNEVSPKVSDLIKEVEKSISVRVNCEKYGEHIF